MTTVTTQVNRSASTGAEYRGVKRIRQACGNCRRKKARCSGDRPTCSICLRLSQKCEYADNYAGRAPQFGSDQETLPDLVLTRLMVLEAEVNQLRRGINSQSKASTPQQQGDIILGSLLDRPGSAPLLSGSEDAQTVRTLPVANLPPPPPHVIQDLVDCFFLYCHNQPYSLFHENSSRRRLATGMIPDFLLYVILASAIRYSTAPFFKGRQAQCIEEYANELWKDILVRWNVAGEDTDISSAQAMLLHSIIDFTGGKMHRAWIKVGIAARICQDLQLMLEPDAKLPPCDQEERRRIFWSTYMLDKFVTCGRRRPSAMLDEDCKVQLPCDEQVFRLGSWEKTLSLDQISKHGPAISKVPSSFDLAIFMTSTLGQTARYCLHEHSHASKVAPWNATSNYASIYSTLLYFESTFYMKGPLKELILNDYTSDGTIDQQRSGHLVLTHVLFNLCQCLLHHPFILLRKVALSRSQAPESFLRRASTTCREHATTLSSLLSDAKAAGCIISTSIYGYCALVAGSIHALNLHSEVTSVRQESAKSFSICLEFLQMLSHYWNNASIMLNWLEKFQSLSDRYNILLSLDARGTELDLSATEILWGAIDYGFISNPASIPDFQAGLISSENSERPISRGWSPKSWLDYDHSISNGPETMNTDMGDTIELPDPDMGSFSTTRLRRQHDGGSSLAARLDLVQEPTNALSPLSLFLTNQIFQ